jgi:hypothetical protein
MKVYTCVGCPEGKIPERTKTKTVWKLNTEVSNDFARNKHDITNRQVRVPIGSSDSNADQRAADIRFEERPVNGRNSNAGHQMLQPMERG